MPPEQPLVYVQTIPFYLSSLSVNGLASTPDQPPVGTAADMGGLQSTGHGPLLRIY